MVNNLILYAGLVLMILAVCLRFFTSKRDLAYQLGLVGGLLTTVGGILI